jgi:hypothetical protein
MTMTAIPVRRRSLSIEDAEAIIARRDPNLDEVDAYGTAST